MSHSGMNMLLMAVQGSRNWISLKEEGMMWVPAPLYSSSFLTFFPFGPWIDAQLCMSSVNALRRIQLSTHCNSGCQFSSLNLLTNCLLVYLLHFQVIFFTYYLFLTAEQGILSEAALVTVTQQNAYFWCYYFCFSVSPVMKIWNIWIWKNGDFCLPLLSTWPLSPSRLKPWKISWWKHNLPM